MKESAFIKKIRTKFTTFLAGSVVSEEELSKKIDVTPDQIKKILVSRPNHRLGNQLLTSPLIRELEQTFPEATIDIFVKGGASFAIFQNYESVGEIINLPKDHFKKLGNYLSVWLKIKRRHYDLVVNADKDSSSGNLCVKISNADFKVFGDPDVDVSSKPADYVHYAKYPIYDFRDALDPKIYDRAGKAIPELDVRLNEQEKAYGAQVLRNLVKNDKPSICLFTNATGNKIYSEEWWIPFYEALKETFQDYNIVELLPIENTSKINFAAPNLYSKDLREMAGFINACELFIAPDNGTMHLAASTSTPVIGFFKNNTIYKYRPFGDNKIAFNTNESQMADWINAAKDILK